jgi:hypothetical protein
MTGKISAVTLMLLLMGSSQLSEIFSYWFATSTITSPCGESPVTGHSLTSDSALKVLSGLVGFWQCWNWYSWL